MKMENKILRCWWSRSGQEQIYKKVKTIEEAIAWLKKQTKKDLEDESIIWNAGGLMEFDESMVSDDEDGWGEFYNEEGQDIMEIIDEMEEKNCEH